MMMASDTNLRDAAIAYAENGYAIFPLSPLSKKPLKDSCGLKDATTDIDQIEKWWSDNPSANIGLSTDGLFVVDVDGADNPFLKDDPVAHSDLFQNAVATTPRDGVHYYFAQSFNQGLRNTTSRLAENVDTRANGGYIVVSPSRVVDSEKGIDGQYTWNPEFPLESRDELSTPPRWLVAMLDRSKTPMDSNGPIGSDSADKFPNGQRNSGLTSIAGKLRRQGFDSDEINASLQAVNQKRCDPPLSAGEVSQIANSVGNYEPAKTLVQKPKLSLIDSDQFDKTDYREHYLVKGVLAAGQNCIIGGASKTLKTSIAVDLALSLGTGTKFLGEFNVPEAVQVAIISGESGGFTLQETARRIAFSKDVSLSTAKVLWGFQLPQLSQQADLDEVRALITDNELDVLMIDPLYMCLLSAESASQASNVFAMGQYLRNVSEIGQETGCTIVCLHHTRKQRLREHEPVELEDLSMSGFAEWARQWVLIGRRSQFEPGTGLHELWLTVGGSAGHNGLWATDVNEGVKDDLTGRKWEVTIQTGSEIRQEQQQAAENRKAEKQEEIVRGHQDKILKTLRKYPDGLTITSTGQKSGINHANTTYAIELLSEEGLIEECEVIVSNQKKKRRGFKMSQIPQSEPPRQNDNTTTTALSDW